MTHEVPANYATISHDEGVRFATPVGEFPTPGISLPNPEVDSSRGVFQKLGGVSARGAMLAAAVTTYAWEQSPENERFRTEWAGKALTFGNEVFESVDQRLLSVPGKALMVGGVVAGITFAVETITGVITAATISQKRGMLGKFNSLITKLASKLEVTDSKGKPKGDAAIALAGGAAPLVVKRHAESGGTRTFSENAKSGARAAAGIAAFSGTLGVAASVAVDTADIHGHTAGALETIDVMSRSTTWWAIYGYVLGMGLLGNASQAVGQKLGAWYYSRNASVKNISESDTV